MDDTPSVLYYDTHHDATSLVIIDTDLTGPIFREEYRSLVLLGSSAVKPLSQLINVPKVFILLIIPEYVWIYIALLFCFSHHKERFSLCWMENGHSGTYMVKKYVLRLLNQVVCSALLWFVIQAIWSTSLQQRHFMCSLPKKKLALMTTNDRISLCSQDASRLLLK